MKPSVNVQNLSKNYGDTKALKEISFSVEKGELFGFIGPDGAGKTTLFRILATLLLANSGSATVEGYEVVKDYKKIRQIIGYMPGRFSLYQDLTVEENLRFFATIFGTTIEENYDLIKEIYSQIEPFKTRKAGKLSGGMKQKLALSCALIHKPEVLFLDEPTTGVDAVSRQEFWEMLKRLKVLGITIVVSTPYMDEAGLCDRVALIQDGSIMQISTPDAVAEAYPLGLFSVTSADIYQLLHDLQKLPQAHSVFAFGQAAHLSYMKGKLSEADVSGYLRKKDHSEVRVEEIKPTIEDCFMELMQGSGQADKRTSGQENA
ncbi:MAG: ABC transporter ATP-binding protein [Bacteroidia bacterium]|nr:ABC transporter ATP-binding protein [Bacteroidia bacterium]